MVYFWIFLVDFCEGFEEVGADDATALPDAADFGEVDVPFLFMSSFFDEEEAFGVA